MRFSLVIFQLNDISPLVTVTLTFSVQHFIHIQHRKTCPLFEYFWIIYHTCHIVNVLIIFWCSIITQYLPTTRDTAADVVTMLASAADLDGLAALSDAE